jgi:glucose-1-phosphate adenylyltransferase
MIVATQYRPETLTRYLTRGWASHFVDGGLCLRDGLKVAPDEGGYSGTAAAIHANAAEIDKSGATEVLVLAADHVYDMDYAPMIAAHRASGHTATIAVDQVAISKASAFGVVHADATGHVTDFLEKPRCPPSMPGNPAHALVSMGIYVFDWKWLRQRLQEDAQRPESSHDFGHDILPLAVNESAAQIYRRPSDAGSLPYWRDVGTLDAYRLAQLDFQSPTPPCALPVLGLASAPSHAMTWPNDALPMGENAYRSARLQANGNVVLPGAYVAKGARLRNTIVATNAYIPAGLVIGEDPVEDARWFRRTTGGTVLITADMLARRAAQRIAPRTGSGLKTALTLGVS